MLGLFRPSPAVAEVGEETRSPFVPSGPSLALVAAVAAMPALVGRLALPGLGPYARSPWRFAPLVALVAFLARSELLRYVTLQRPLPPPPKKRLTGVASVRTLQHGLDRRVLFYVPPTLEERRKKGGLPLVIAFHGSLESPEVFRTSTTDCRFDEEADQRGFLLAYPQGFGGNWNDGRKAGKYPAATHNVDDVGFVKLLVEHAVKEWGVDASKVFVAGFSNGGHFCIRLLYELGAPYLASAASFSASLVPPSLSRVDLASLSPPPCPIVLLHGTEDPIIPFEGGEGALFTALGGSIRYGPRGMHLSSTETGRVLAERWSGLLEKKEYEPVPAVQVTDYASPSAGLGVRTVALKGESHRVSHAGRESCPNAYGPRASKGAFDAVGLVMSFWEETRPGHIEVL